MRTSVGTFREAGAGSGGRSGHCGAEAARCDSEGGHVFLGLEQDDVDFGGKQAAENHRTTQTDGDTHSGGLDLKKKKRWKLCNYSTYLQFRILSSIKRLLRLFQCHLAPLIKLIDLLILFISYSDYSQTLNSISRFCSQPFSSFSQQISISVQFPIFFFLQVTKQTRPECQTCITFV